MEGQIQSVLKATKKGSVVFVDAHSKWIGLGFWKDAMLTENSLCSLGRSPHREQSRKQWHTMLFIKLKSLAKVS